MSGIYVHVPFCIKKCNYCNFYSQTELSAIPRYIAAIKKEIALRKTYLQEPVESIYFGGGTPSLLSVKQINELIGFLFDNFEIKSQTEITLEANPNNLNEHYLSDLTTTKINRLSIGIQSFFDRHLTVLGRVHSAKQAHKSLQDAQKVGFDNLSVDLMFGFPNLEKEQWKENLENVKDVKHLSCYALSLEPHSKLFQQVQSAFLSLPCEEDLMEQFDILENFAQEHHFLHYETSNFCKENYFARHNTAYWQQKPYLGLGPSAHSFCGQSRQWNKGDLQQYCLAVEQSTLSQQVPFFEQEQLSKTMQINEYLMTSLRTIWGCDLDYVEHHFGPNIVLQLKENLQQIASENYTIKNNKLQLTQKGQMLADAIACNLFFDSLE